MASELAHLADEIRKYQPCNQQEAADKAVLLAALESELSRPANSGEPSCLTRNSNAHFTCSAWLVDPDRTQTLMVYHKIYDSWSWIGGHADGCADLAAVAARELAEETGVTSAKAMDGIASLEVLPVAGHMKRGEWVSSHVHLNVTYLFQVEPEAVAEQLHVCESENTGVKWIPFEKVAEASTEPWMVERIYKKLIGKSLT